MVPSPKLPTGPRRVVGPGGAWGQAHGTRLSKGGGCLQLLRGLWMQMSAGLQFAAPPSRCCHGVLPGEVGSCPPKSAYPGGSTLIVKEHRVLSADQSSSPHGQVQNAQPGCSLPYGWG